MASSSFCSATAVAALRLAEAVPGAANRGAGTGTIVRFAMVGDDCEGVGLGATETEIAGVGAGVGGTVMTGDGVVLPHAARAAARARPNKVVSGRMCRLRDERPPGITTCGLLLPAAIAGRRRTGAA